MQVEKTVFISYRRTNEFTARAIYQDLTTNGYDAFLDFETIDSGAFGRVILNQIAARAHFLIVLTPSALERCNEPGDWLRREIEYAIELQRNVVPLMFEGFDFGKASEYMTGKMAVLPQYNGVSVPKGYFDEAMTRLRTRFLNKPLGMILHPTPSADIPIVEQQQAAAEEHAPVTEEQLTAEEYFERAVNRDEMDYEGQVADYSEAIRLNPRFASAYSNRGATYKVNNELNKAIADFSEALRIDPEFVVAYTNRAAAYIDKGELDQAISDCTEAIRIDNNDPIAYYNRGNAYLHRSDLDKALDNYNKAISIDPQYAAAYSNRAAVKIKKRNMKDAISDCNEAIRIVPNYADVYNNRGTAQLHIGEPDKALEDYNKAISIDPQYAAAYSNRGEVYFEMKEYQKAANDFKQAHEIKPAYSFPLAGLAISNHALERYEQANGYWVLLTSLDERYKDFDWVTKELNWREPLIEEARKLVAKL